MIDIFFFIYKNYINLSNNKKKIIYHFSINLNNVYFINSVELYVQKIKFTNILSVNFSCEGFFF